MIRKDSRHIAGASDVGRRIDPRSRLADKAPGKSIESMTNSAANDQEPAFIEVGNGEGQRRIAVRVRAGAAPGLIWLGGFNSDMKGTKALALDAWAANPAAPSSTEPSGAGWKSASRCSSNFVAARRS
jgi:hypothetical protein